MIHLVLCGHGTFGSSLLESLSMFLPEISEVSVIDFHKDMGVSELTDLVRLKLDELGDQPTIFVTDMVGGAPFKTCAIEILDKQNKLVIAGINLTSLLDLYFQREDDLFVVAKRAVQVSQESTDFYPKE